MFCESTGNNDTPGTYLIMAMSKQGIPGNMDPVEPVESGDPRTTNRDRIEPDPIKAWAKRLNVSTTRLCEAVRRTGPVVQDVKQNITRT